MTAYKLLPTVTSSTVLLFLLLLITLARGVVSQSQTPAEVNFAAWNASCNSTHYRCVNKNCIPLRKVNNTINDCGDNTDEGVLQTCMFTERNVIVRSLMDYFQCTTGTCIDIKLWLNGITDCADNSDETKLIGTSCSTSPLSCCPCNETVADSICDSQATPSPPKPNPITDGFDGACRCRPGFYANELGTNCTKRVLGDQCSTDLDCTGAIAKTKCSSEYGRGCECAPGFYNMTVISCIARKIDDECAVNTDCSSVINNSTCELSRCKCTDGLVPVQDKTSCVKPYIGALQCTSNTVCLIYFNNSRCINPPGLCQCQPGFYTSTNNLNCVSYIIGSRCSTSALPDGCSIAIGNSSCINDHCQCMTGYRGNTTACTPRKHNDTCSKNEDCQLMGNSTCRYNTCQCRGLGYQLNADGTQCTLRRLNDSCFADEQCSSAVQHTRCQLPPGRCRCSTGYKMAADGRSCTRKLVDDECDNEADCATVIEHAECRNGRCECRQDYRVVNGDRSTCQMIPLYELSCINNAQCNRTEHALCGSNGRCECGCSTVFSTDGFTCERIQVSSLSCQSDDRCVTLLNMSTCLAGHCECRHSYYKSLDGAACVNTELNITRCSPPPSFDNICHQTIQFSECSQHGVCQCIAGYQSAGTRRCVPSIFSQRCMSDWDCTSLIRDTQCILPMGYCACVDGFNTTDGVACSYDPVCPTPICTTLCGAFIGLFFGALVASLLAFFVLYQKKLKKRKPRKVAPMPGAFTADRAWHLDWNNRPPAHVPVMYKSPSLRAPDELYGDLLQLNLHDVLSTMIPGGHTKSSLTTVSQA